MTAIPPEVAITPEAVIAAREAFAKVYNDPVTLAECLAAALDAAAPLIAAAERERIREQLPAWAPPGNDQKYIEGWYAALRHVADNLAQDAP